MDGSIHRWMRNILVLQCLLAYSAFSQHSDFSETDFSKVDSLAIHYKYQGHLDPVRIAIDLTNGLEKDIDKYRVIFRWISENIDYDLRLYSKIVAHNQNARRSPAKYKRWVKRFRKIYINHTIRSRTTICEGYSWLLEIMCRTAGLSCVSIPGYVRDHDSMIGVKTKPNHAWNAVKIDNKWYLSDPTWASGYVDFQRTKYYRRFNETYFLVSPDEFIANHYPVDPQWILLLDKPTLAEFVNSPIKTTAFIENKIPNYSPTVGKVELKMDSSFQFRFSMNKALISLYIERSTFRNGTLISESFANYPATDKEGYYVSSVSFDRKGHYSINVFINGILTFIYKVAVK
jgi:hypothetical protein